MVGTWPPPPPLIPALSVSASSQVTTMDPPALYHDVDWTWGMKLDRKASPCWTVPSCSSLTRLGVHPTKLGGPRHGRVREVLPREVAHGVVARVVGGVPGQVLRVGLLGDPCAGQLVGE